MKDIARLVALNDLGQCWEEVSRIGQAQACDRLAVAVRRGLEDEHAYPVCAFHARGDMVPIADIVKASRGDS